ncbi:MAG: 4-(cytidine 5'-diphospho)-2-C-methyl-D-erythritol kinase [Rhodospirillales bacterium]|nr:4-(cytidine 5'-diphospho)-2-C-methyl-D-erythritol kinase [Rhodospirillales bacterium]
MTREPGAGREIAVEAPAKLNLYLHVTGKRADGYHLLDSLIAFADVGDTVSVAPAGGLRLTVTGPFAADVPPGPDNLVLKAAHRLADAAEIVAGAAIALVKRLPVASGIGGGSADAAAALKALARLWSLRLADDRMQALALGLGADVPVCLAGKTSFIGGIGEKIEPAPALPPAALVLVNPRRPLATPAVFKARTAPFGGAGRFAETPADAAALARLLRGRRNDLASAAESLEPAIGRVLDLLEAQPGALLARMSGSGATCFGLFQHGAAARRAAAAIQAAEPGWWVKAGRFVSGAGGPAL